jgi:heme exporter protein A
VTSHSSPAAATGTLAARALACRRGRRLLFSGLDLTLPPGSITWLRGANGSGKTSLMRLLAGLSAPDQGEVLWNGTPLPRAGEAARAGLLYIGHANALKDDLTLAEALAFLAQLQGLDAPLRRATAALDRLGLASRAGALVRTLSQGQRRRGALARLVLDEATPRTWILDERFDALDQASVATLAALIEAQAARGGAVLLTSHQAVTLAGLQTFDLAAAPGRMAHGVPA